MERQFCHMKKAMDGWCDSSTAMWIYLIPLTVTLKDDEMANTVILKFNHNLNFLCVL
jgi:hypothetical protein